MTEQQSMRSLLALAVLAAFALTAPACSPTTGGGAEPAAFTAGSSTGEAAPEMLATYLDGKAFSLADSNGKVRLVDFWATWCAPCREEIPMLIELDETYRAQGLEIVAISDESVEVLREFVAREGVTYTNLVDAFEKDGETTTGKAAEDFTVLGLPTAFLIDRDGNIVERFTGPKPARVLEKQIRELLELPPA